MRNDYDVKVGIQTVGDASGAQQVDAAVKQVGETAKQVSQDTAQAAQQSTEATAQAAQQAAAAAGDAAQKVGGIADELAEAGKAAGGLGELSAGVDGLKDALGKLSPEKARGLVNGLTEALLGLGSGDIGSSLAGVGKTLFSFANMIPLPGAAAALGIGVTAIAALYKLIGESTDEPARKLNDFGETVDQEMERLESWAQSQFEWEGIKNANAAVRADFDLLKGSADAALSAMQGVFNAQSNARTSALQREAAAAEAAGDTGRAAELNQQVEDEKAKSELVNLRLEMVAAKAEAEEQTALLRLQKENNDKVVSESAAATANLSSINEQIRAITGNLDATKDPEAMAGLVETLNQKLDVIAGLQASLNAQGGVSGNSGYFESAGKMEGLSSARAELELLVASLKGYSDIVKEAKEREDEATAARNKSNEEAIKAATNLTELGLKIEALKIQIESVESAVGPEVSAAAQEQAGLMAGEVGDFLERTLQLTTDNVQGILDAKAASVDAMTTAAGDLETAKAAYAQTVGLADIPPVMEIAAKGIEEGNKLIRESVENTGKDAVAAGAELQKGAEEFRVTIVGASTGYKAAAVDLATTSKSVGEMARDLAQSQRSISLEVAAQAAEVRRALSAAESARADAGLALSQIRNQ